MNRLLAVLLFLQIVSIGLLLRAGHHYVTGGTRQFEFEHHLVETRPNRPNFPPLLTKLTNAPCAVDIVVAVIDTGIDYTHPKLRDNIWVNKGEVGRWESPSKTATTCHNKSCNQIDDDGNGFIDDVAGWDFVNDIPLPYDTHGHGTHIAGIILQNSISRVGDMGICPTVSIMPLKYYDNSGLGYSNLQNTIRAIEYATMMGANIINYSGGGADPAPAERAAIVEAMKKNILFVAAAGNDGHNDDSTPYYPANYGFENIISVASLNTKDQLLPSSNFGSTVTMAALGLSVASTLPDGKYGTMSGTSQATAIVSGTAAALASQLNKKSDFDFRKLKRWLVDGTKPLRGNEKHTILSSGILSPIKSQQIMKDEMSGKRVYQQPKVLPDNSKGYVVPKAPDKSARDYLYRGW